MNISLNSTARSALSLLTGSSVGYERTLTKVATGKDVDRASDNAAYWSIAKTMGSTRLSNTAAQDAIGFSQAMTDIAAIGISAATDVVSQIRSRLVLATSLTSGRDKVNAEITQLKDQLQFIAGSANFAGQNWLKLGEGETPSTKELVSSVSTDKSGNPVVNTLDVDTTGLVLVSEEDAGDGLLTSGHDVTTKSGGSYTYNLLDAGSSNPAWGSTEISVSDDNTTDEIAGMIAATTSILSGLTEAGTRIGATQSTLDAQNEFLNDLNDAITRGVGGLVDTNLEEQSAKLSAQGVQAKLQTQMLNIANANGQASVALYR